MIIFIKADGTAINVVPSPVYQGSSISGSLYFVAPFPNTNAVSVAFILANGDYTEEYALTSISELSGVTDRLGDEYSIWEWQTKNGLVTKYPGKVSVQFKVSYYGEIVATTSTDFTVQKGVPSLPSTVPDVDQWQALLETYSFLAGRVTDLEKRQTAKALLDFSCMLTNEGTFYEYTKTYTDGTTATFIVPTAGQSSEIVRSELITSVFFTAPSWIMTADGSYELGFGAGQTGMENSSFLALLDSVGQATYKAETDFVPTQRSGYCTQADSIFKGSDGSVLLTSNVAYDGRLLLLSGAAFSENMVKSIRIENGNIVVGYINGTTEIVTVPWTTSETVDDKIREALSWKIII